jgi:hypothetical protein
MSEIFGALNLNDTDRVFAATQGQRVIYDVANAYIDRVNAEANLIYSTFIEETTPLFKERYKLPGSGYMQKIGPQSKPGLVKAYGQWDVAYPLEEWADGVGGSRVEMAYMSVADLDRTIRSVTVRHVNTLRREILKALLEKEEDTFIDPLNGTLLIEPLANGDTVSYPPTLGSAAEATESHYYGSNYAASSISDTNNPFATIRGELDEHFGEQAGGSNIVAFIHPDQKAKTESLTDYDPVPDANIRVGTGTDVPVNIPTGLPGIIIGRSNGIWIAEWRWMPTGYIFGLHLGEPKPLKKRIDPPDTGLGNGDLRLVAADLENYPFKESYWSARFGIGCGNRLNGVGIYLTGSTTYTSPSL